MFTKIFKKSVLGISLALFALLLLPTNTYAAKGSVYKQSFKDEEIGVSFSYDLKKPLTVTDVYSIDGESTIARSFTEGNKEGLHLSLNNKQDTDLFRFAMKIVMFADGEVDEEGNYFEVTKSNQKATYLKKKLEVYDIVVTDEDDNKLGATIYIYSLRDKKGKEIGSVTFSNGWGEEFPDSMAQESTYNGEPVSLQPYFAVEKKSDAFLKQILKTIKIDEKAALNAINGNN